MASKFTTRSTTLVDPSRQGRFLSFGLKDNPFPPEPFINRRSKDSRINGTIYDDTLRRAEYRRLQEQFLEKPRNEGNHLKLGYIEDTSYLGRGNGKSAFILHANDKINQSYCLDMSANCNKCFAIAINPEAGGKTKTFDAFVDLFFDAIIESRILDIAIGSLLLESVASFDGTETATNEIIDEDSLLESVFEIDWYEKHSLGIYDVLERLRTNPFLSDIKADSPLSELCSSRFLMNSIVNGSDCKRFYTQLKKGKPRYDFVFNDATRVFLAAGFNGAFAFVDDFEKIPEFQSARQKKDFASELRSVLFDGPYVGSAYGFYTILLVLHAGVPRLIQEAWQSAGVASRSPIGDHGGAHVIPFEKLDAAKVSSLFLKYLDEFRIDQNSRGTLLPFSQGAIGKLAEACDFNLGKILKNAHTLLELAAEQNATSIDNAFVANRFADQQNEIDNDLLGSISGGIDLIQKAGDGKANQ